MPRVRAPVRVSRVYRVRDAYTREELGSFWEIACARENSGNFRESRVTCEDFLGNPSRARKSWKTLTREKSLENASGREPVGKLWKTWGKLASRAYARARAGGRARVACAGAGGRAGACTRTRGICGKCASPFFFARARATLFFRVRIRNSFFFACANRVHIAYTSCSLGIFGDFTKKLRGHFLFLT